VYAAVKFILFTMVGSLPMLVALIYLALAHARSTGTLSFALTDLYGLQLGTTASWWACLALVLAFAIKVPMWPLHTWLPDAHVEAPTGGSVIPRRRAAEDGHVRFSAFRAAVVPASAAGAAAVDRRARRRRHRLRRARRHGAART
jgi:NADH-quinone oxidoreductase subunit M